VLTQGVLNYIPLDSLSLFSIEKARISVCHCYVFLGIVALLPFMTLHMRMLGITDEETGYIMAMFAIFSLLTPFIFTTIADKVGNFKVTILSFV
jgi:MFS family permease